jgi:hypothetical protein
MPGFMELMKIVKDAYEDEIKDSNNINSLFLKIRNSSNLVNQVPVQNMDDNIVADQESNDTQEYVSHAEAARKEDDKRRETVEFNNKPDIIKEIFKYEFDNDRLVEGMIFTEVFGKPLSKRRGQHRRAR